MAELKTQRNNGDVRAFLATVEHNQRREDSLTVLELMEEITGEPAKMWGESIVGFGSYQYKYANGRDGEWFVVGFAPRKQALTLYIMSGFEAYDSLLENLGKFKTGKACLYIKKLTDVDMNTLRELITQSVEHMSNQSVDD